VNIIHLVIGVFFKDIVGSTSIRLTSKPPKFLNVFK